VIRRQLVHYRGRELDTGGDGLLASFDGPARAIRCASSISDSMHARRGRSAHRPPHRGVRAH
jgi:class 3 adenylate cyclase